MLFRVYHDPSLLGHSLANIPVLVWSFSKSEISSRQTFCQFVEFVARRILAPPIALIATLTALPLGFTAKILHYKMRPFFFLTIALTRLVFASPIAVTFLPPEDLQKALVEPPSIHQHLVFQSDQISVYYPKSPRVPHHLAIALNRLNVSGVTDVSDEENQAIFGCIRKITEIYKQIDITGFVIAQYDNPQQGHLNRYVVEIIPHLPGFNSIKNIADKVDCNRHVLFRHANISPVVCAVAKERIEEKTHFWREAFQQETPPLTAEDITTCFPHHRYESHEDAAREILEQHLVEISQNIEPAPLSTGISMPMEVPDNPKAIKVTRCPFCDPAILQKQRVFEHNGVEVLYNIRKGEKPGCAFLVLPKRHNQKVYGLSKDEIHSISIVRKALVHVLGESHPDQEVIIYTQDDPAVGQTVLHSHEQIVSVDPDTIALSWTLRSLYPSGNVTDEEMAQVTKEFGQKMQQKITELFDIL